MENYIIKISLLFERYTVKGIGKSSQEVFAESLNPRRQMNKLGQLAI